MSEKERPQSSKNTVGSIAAKPIEWTIRNQPWDVRNDLTRRVIESLSGKDMHTDKHGWLPRELTSIRNPNTRARVAANEAKRTIEETAKGAKKGIGIGVVMDLATDALKIGSLASGPGALAVFAAEFIAEHSIDAAAGANQNAKLRRAVQCIGVMIASERELLTVQHRMTPELQRKLGTQELLAKEMYKHLGGDLPKTWTELAAGLIIDKPMEAIKATVSRAIKEITDGIPGISPIVSGQIKVITEAQVIAQMFNATGYAKQGQINDLDAIGTKNVFRWIVNGSEWVKEKLSGIKSQLASPIPQA